jgi:hypothetical protein
MNGRIVSLFLLAMLFFSLTVVDVKGNGNVWIETASMHVERAYDTATLLKDGQVLVAGGMRNSSNSDNGLSLGTNSCELYDPSTGSWSVTGSLHDNRFGHTATLLNDGRVLVVGGMISQRLGLTSSCELYDPATGSWNLTGSLNIPRYFHTATLLSDGNVLVAGGHNGSARVLECELYDPTNGVWVFTGALNVGRTVAASALLASGMALIAGGLDESLGATSICELYDPSTGTWRYTKPMNVARAWMQNGAVLLQNGSFLVTGGGDGFTTSFASCELYDLNTETWTLTGSLNFASWGHTALLLSNGQVLVVGWRYCEAYDPATGAWTILAQTLYNTVLGTATLLTDGRVLAAGGIVYLEPITSCELFTVGAHDVAVRHVEPFKTVVGQGTTLPFNVTVANMGDYPEEFNVTLYCNATATLPNFILGAVITQTVTLKSGNPTTITFLCDTTGFAYGNYTINAVAGPVSGETNTGDNTLSDGTILVTIPGDLNGDLKVTLSDLVILANAYGSKPGDIKWNPNSDINGSGKVDLADLVTMAIHYGQHYP